MYICAEIFKNTELFELLLLKQTNEIYCNSKGKKKNQQQQRIEVIHLLNSMKNYSMISHPKPLTGNDGLYHPEIWLLRRMPRVNKMTAFRTLSKITSEFWPVLVGSNKEAIEALLPCCSVYLCSTKTKTRAPYVNKAWLIKTLRS